MDSATQIRSDAANKETPFFKAHIESIRYSDIGQPLTASLMDYSVPRADEVPPFTLLHLTTQSPHAPHGVKGAGEGGTVAPGGAIANAISNALDRECNELPATPSNVLDLMRLAHSASLDLQKV